MNAEPLLFALQRTRPLGERVAARLGLALAEHEERDFEDGEHKARPLAAVQGRDVYVLHSLHGEPDASANDKLCRLLFFLAAVRDAGAARVTAVVPYLAYSRKDRRTKPRDPVTTSYVARLFEAVRTDRVVTLDVHNLAAFENAFRIEAINLEAKNLLVRHLLPALEASEPVVVSPDAGGSKRAEAFRRTLEEALDRAVGNAIMEKHRSAGVVSGDLFAGEVEGRIAIIVDDLISSGGTMLRSARACLARGAREVYAVATHGLFTGDAAQVVADPAMARIVATDAVPPFRLPEDLARRRLELVEVAPLLAEAIRRLHGGGSLVELGERSALA